MHPVQCGKEPAIWKKVRKAGVVFSQENTLVDFVSVGSNSVFRKGQNSSEISGTNISLSESRI